MKSTDSHLHMQDYKTNNAQQIIKDMKDKGFVSAVCISSTFESWKKVANIATRYSDFIIPAFGLHPWYIKQSPLDWEQQLRSYLSQYSTAQIGECGLDCLKAEIEGQQEVFAKQIDLSTEFSRPLNIHLLKAEEWFIKFLPNISTKFMIHSFSGSSKFLHTIIDAGGFISLSFGILKRKNGLATIKEVPVSRLLVESDGPYLSDYSQVPELIRSIANIKEIDVEELSSVIYSNFREFNYGE